MDLKKPEVFIFDPGTRIPQEHWDEILPTLTPPERIKKHCMIERDNNGYRSHRRHGRINER